MCLRRAGNLNFVSLLFKVNLFLFKRNMQICMMSNMQKLDHMLHIHLKGQVDNIQIKSLKVSCW